ncbi:MAG: NAD(P)/FAD-dependent oxidoreductase [Gammaproteobacteria bacterium]
MPGDSVAVLGAGGVGVCAALMLRRRGRDVFLIDRAPPASETSGGNAGIVSDSSAVPLNNPSLRANLFSLLCGGESLRLHRRYAAANLPWLWRFWKHSAADSSARRARSLYALLSRSKTLHRRWMAECGLRNYPREGGWMKCYRRERSFAAAAAERRLWDSLGVRYEIADAARIAELAPSSRPLFARGVYLPETFSAPDPRRAVREYAKQFSERGGRFMREDIRALRPLRDGWETTFRGGGKLKTKAAVVALGPWSRDFLRRMNIRAPIAFERGGHRNFAPGDAELNVAVADVDGGYIAVMQETSVRMTSGVYFAGLDAPPPKAQLDAAERRLREAVHGLGAQIGGDWFGARPTAPDAMPIVGECKIPGLWLATAHQHIGFATAPATGELVADLMCGDAPRISAAAFSPARFGL